MARKPGPFYCPVLCTSRRVAVRGLFPPSASIPLGASLLDYPIDIVSAARQKLLCPLLIVSLAMSNKLRPQMAPVVQQCAWVGQALAKVALAVAVKRTVLRQKSGECAAGDLWHSMVLEGCNSDTQAKRAEFTNPGSPS